MTELPNQCVVIHLPWPPSVNHYYRTAVVKGRVVVFVSGEGKRYQEIVKQIIEREKVPTFFGRLRLAVNAWPPDRRRRDLDNVLKAIQDSLQKCGAYKDDCQIDQLEICRQDPYGEGSVEVSIRELPGSPGLFDEPPTPERTA